jgi:hypothetical protein
MSEKPNQIQKSEESTENNLETGKFEIHREKFEKIARFAGIAGMIGVAAYSAKEVYAEYDSVLDHKTHIESTLTSQELQEYQTLKLSLEDYYGEEVFDVLVAGDRAAFETQSTIDQKPSFEGFDRESEFGEMANIDFYPSYVFTESFGMYPEGWLNSEISQIIIQEKSDNSHEDGSIEGGSYNMESNFVVIYDISDEFSIDDTFFSESFHDFMQHTFAHEAGHANDWESKGDLNILERAQLLQSVTDRVLSDTAYSDKSMMDGSDYWRSFDDGTEAGLRLMAKEYWAEICAAYFTKPDSLHAAYPEDFELVQRMVLKTDSEFDISDPERGAFDPVTGEVRDRWVADVQELIE